MKLLEQWSSHPRINDTYELLIGIIGITAGLITIMTFMENSDSPVIPVVGIMAFLAVILYGFYRLKQAWDVNERRIQIIGNRLHAFSHTVRDAYSLLRTYKRRNELNEALIYGEARATAQACVDYLADVLTELAATKLVVTLQFFHGTVTNPDDQTDYRISTLARSYNCDNASSRVDKVFLSQHAPYREIIREGRQHYIALDLMREAAEYKKRTGADLPIGNRNWPDAYKSLIVVPIRIEWNVHEVSPQGEFSHVLMGFISIDSPDPNPFPEEHAKAYCALAKGYSDSMFHYLERVDFYLDQIRPSTPRLAKEAT